MPALARMTAAPPERPIGTDLMHNPRLTKGTAFTLEERRTLGLEGLARVPRPNEIGR